MQSTESMVFDAYYRKNRSPSSTSGIAHRLTTLMATGLTLDACVRAARLPALASLLAKLPDLRVVLDHLGKPPAASGDDGSWERNTRALAALLQVMIKLSGIARKQAKGAMCAIRPNRG